MSTTNTLHGQMTVVDANGNVQILHQETSASDVLVNNTNNTNGDNGASAIPSGIKNLQQLTNNIGMLAFKSEIKVDDLATGIVTNTYNTTTSGKILDARAGKDLNDRIKTIEESEVLVMGDELDDTEISVPESEINDGIVSPTLTWSSEKINDIFTQISGDAGELVFYIPLIEKSNGVYESQKTVVEIEEAYQLGKAIWVVASEIFLPLRQRVDANTWIFSGYVDSQAYDITITNSGVNITYKEIVTTNDALPNPNALKLTGAVSAVYDGSTEVEVEVPEASAITLAVPKLVQGATDYTDEDKALVRAFIDRISAASDPIIVLELEDSSLRKNFIPASYYKQTSYHYIVGINPDSFPGEDSSELQFVYVRYNTSNNTLTINEHAYVGDTGEWLDDYTALEEDYRLATNNLVFQAINLALGSFDAVGAVESVNGKTGVVTLNASDVGARPSNWMPSASDVGADSKGTADNKVTAHNTSDTSHNDIRLLIEGLTSRLNTLCDSDDTTLDQLSEIVAYIKSNKSLIDGITTSKVSVTDIIDNLNTSAANKPLSAKQGVALKTLIDAIEVPNIVVEEQSDGIAIMLDGKQTFIPYGRDGEGIQSIDQTKSSNVSEGVNEITVTTNAGREFSFTVKNGSKGESGVYVGPGDMPDGFNVQIDPDGEVIDVLGADEVRSIIAEEIAKYEQRILQLEGEIQTLTIQLSSNQ